MDMTYREHMPIVRYAAGIILAGTPLLVIEILSRRFRISPEWSRKLVHAGSCVTVCAMTLFLTMPQIAIIAGSFVILMLAGRRIRLWRALYRVERRSWGEVMLPLGVVGAALLSRSTAMFIVAMLTLGLADTAAAYVGSRWGRHRLPVISQKSWAGSGACLVVALVVGLGVNYFDPVAPLILILGAAGLATLAEALSGEGSDNVTMPLAVIAILRLTA